MSRILTILFMLSVLAGCLYVWDVFRQDLAQAPEPSCAVPDDALVYVRLHPDWITLPNASSELAALLAHELPGIALKLSTLDSLRLTHPDLQEVLSDGPFGWSVHKGVSGEFESLLSLGIKPSREAQAREALSLLSDATLWIQDGLVLASASPALLEKAKAQATAEERPPSDLEHAILTAGSPALTLFHRSSPHGGWNHLEVISTRGQTTLAGISQGTLPAAETSGTIPFSTFPASVSALEWYGSSSADFLLGQGDRLADINRLIADLDDQCTCNYLESHFSAQPGFGILSADQPVLVMHASDSLFSTGLLNGYGTLEEAYSGRTLFTLNYPYQSSLLFALPELNLSVAWAEGDWLFLTTSTSHAKTIIRGLSSQRTLDLQVNAATTFRSKETPAHISWTRNGSSGQLEWPLSLPNNIGEALTVQSPFDDKLYASTTLHTGNALTTQEDTGLAVVWEQSLDETPVGRPWTVKNHYTGAREVLIQSKSGRLTLYSATGQRLWSATVDGPVLGDIQQIDLFDNGKLQIAFSTLNSIYVLDRNGNLVDGFPVRLPATATCPLAIFDYDNKHAYRFVIATSNGQFLNYSPDGSLTKGWKADGFSSNVVETRHLRIRTKDYVFAREENGQTHLLKRDGTVRFPTDAGTPGHGLGTTAILKSDDIATCRMLYADTAGNVIEMAFNESISNTELIGIMQGQWPTVADFGGDHAQDIVLVDGPFVKAYDLEFERLFRSEVSGNIGFAPQVFRFSSKDQKVGVVVPEHDEIWLLDDQGNPVSGFPAQGNSPFAIADLDLNGRFELITFVHGDLLRVYALR